MKHGFISDLRGVIQTGCVRQKFRKFTEYLQAKREFLHDCFAGASW